MEESDKTTALKKAYAEIILNTAKESAARVMISDRKSARFHHDLSETKEEAFRLLVRLKHMIDAKTIEGDVVSSNQQRQIDVLEAQLHEAEDIIADLRSEVRWVRDRLEKAKAFESQQRRTLVSKEEEEETVSVHKVDSEVVLESLHPNQEEVADTCFCVKTDSLPERSSLSDVECQIDEKHFEGLSVDACETELDGDIRIKKLELSRNGCTQRIHALERKSSSSENEEEQQEGTSEKDSEENLSLISSGKSNGDEAGTLGNTRCLVLALRASSAEVVTMPSNTLGIKKTSKSRKLRGRRKRRFGKPKATSVRTQSQLIKPCQSQSKVTCSNASTSDFEDSMDIRKGKRSKNMHQTDHLVEEACQESNLVSINVEDAADIPESETKIKPLQRLTSRKDDVLVDVLVSCEGEEEGSVVPQSTKMASSLVNLHPESKVTAVVSDQISESPRANANRLLKYTFQRKRKRGSSNTNEDSNNYFTGKREENEPQDPIKLAEVATQVSES